MDSGNRIVGNGYFWSRGDPLPVLDPLPNFHAGLATDHALLARLADLPLAEVERRLAHSKPYLAWIDETPVAYGWSGFGPQTEQRTGRTMELPPGGRWLWDFVTLPAWRGRGIYPRLLQAILQLEAEARFFLIGHLVENNASRQGILKAGFRHMTDSVLTSAGELQIVNAADGTPFRFPAAGGPAQASSPT